VQLSHGVWACVLSCTPLLAVDDAANWAANARPMIERCCIRCHDGSGPGAYPLRTPAEVAAKRGTILRVLEQHSMPPFLPTHDSLVRRPPEPTKAEVERFAAWCDAGAPVGADGAPVVSARGSAGGAPVLGAPVPGASALRMADAFTITAEEQRTMRSFQVPLGNDTPLLVGGVRVAFDQPGLIARIHLNAVPEQEGRRLDEIDSNAGFRLTGDGAGSPAGALAGCGIDGVFDLPDGFALEIPPRAALIAEAHADGRGTTEAGGFTVSLLAPRSVDGAAPRVCEVMVVGAQNAQADKATALDHTIVTPPLSRGATLVALSLRPGVYATAARLSVERPGEAPSVIVDAPTFDVHQDRPYLLREPLRVPAGSRFMLQTTHPTEATAQKAVPQAVLLVVADAQGEPESSIDTLDELPAVDGAAAKPGAKLKPNAQAIASILAGVQRIGALEVTQELTCPQVHALLGRAGEASTGGVPSCGVSWFDAVLAANALSSACGLSPRYSLASVHAAAGSGAVTGAAVERHKGTGWRLPTDSEWSAIAASGKCADAVGSLWEWCDGADGESRVVRGGCWADTPQARVAEARAAIEPSMRSELFGARLVRRVGGSRVDGGAASSDRSD